jgi:hypothetical protein
MTPVCRFAAAMTPVCRFAAASHVVRFQAGIVCLVVGLAACSQAPFKPADQVRIGASVSPTAARISDTLVIDITAYNAGSKTITWSMGCGAGLGFEIVAANGTVVLDTQIMGCTGPLKTWSVAAGGGMTQRYSLRSLPSLSPGSYRVRGLLGMEATGRREGTTGSLEIVP